MGGEIQPDKKVTAGSSYGMSWGSYGGNWKLQELKTVWLYTVLMTCRRAGANFPE